jgi:DNA-binding response OmpR family regulator
MGEDSVKILVIEDEPLVRESLKDNLETEGYTVAACENGIVGLEAFKVEKPSLVILDVMMPGMDGLEVCRQIRLTAPTIPVIMLTAKSAEIDKVVGLEIGADDYLTKPFGMRELFARVKALLRRAAAMANGGGAQDDEETWKLEFDDVVVDFRTYRATRGGQELEFSAKEFELLRYLASQPDIPVTRGQLLDEVWGYNSYPTTRTVDNFIARLRHKIEQVPDKPKHILTVYGVGYKFVM